MNNWLLPIITGVIVIIIGLIIEYGLIQRKWKRVRSKDNTLIQQTNTAKETKFPELDLSSLSVIERLHQAVKLMNAGTPVLEFSTVRFAEILEMKGVSDFETILAGRNKPTFEFLEKFSNCFGINRNWLKFGTGYPFASVEPLRYYPDNYFDLLLRYDPEHIFFVRSRSENGNSTIILRMHEWKWITFRNEWHISSHVGGNGKAQLLSFYELIRKIVDNQDLVIKCSGTILPHTTYMRLFSGQVFPGSFLAFGIVGEHIHWWDDFIDIYHHYSISKNYQNDYGIEFVKAQKLVVEMLNQKENSKIG
jgi:hypothetical protein